MTPRSVNVEVSPWHGTGVRYLLTVAKIAFSVVILTFLTWRFRNDIPSLSVVDRIAVLEVALLLLLQPALIALRWRVLLRQYDSRASYLSLLSITWVAVFANQFLPAGVGGDAVRIFYAHRLGNSLGGATASVLMDRIFALVALVLLIVVLAPWLPAPLDPSIITLLGVLCVFCLMGLGAVSFAVNRDFHEKIQWPPAKRLAEIVHYVLRALRYPKQSMLVTLVSVLVHLISLAAFLLILEGVGVRAERMPFLAITALLVFVQIIPISVGGWGVREIAAVSLFGTLGVAPGSALLVAIVVGLCYAIASLPGAVIWLFVRSRSARRARDP